MKIIVSGSSGLIGSALVPRLEQGGHDVTRLVRRSAATGEIRWSPENGVMTADLLDGFDAAVHLGGDNIAEGRWNASKKQRIRDSRVNSTRLLAETLASLESKPSAFVCASAIGYYGDRGDESLTEASGPGNGFLSEVCQAWEASTQPARDAGIRVVNMRIGVVLSRNGAALAKMLTPFRLGAGGVMGSGSQFWSCVSRTELVEMLTFAVENEQLTGPVNAISAAVTNREFTKTLGRLIHRPTLFPMPAFAVKLAFGEMGEELMLASTRVRPEKLRSIAYAFKDADIESTLRSALNEPKVETK